MFSCRQMTIGFVLSIAVALMPIGDMAWAQVVGNGGGAANFVNWVLGPQAIGALIGLFVALAGLLLMAGQHTWTGILFTVVGATIVGSAVTIGGMFG